jgi:uncharacterized repeat protein (TIGR01451 family)
VDFALRNEGTVDAINLVATLLAQTGVTQPAPAQQNYGNLLANGAPVSRPFSFKASGTVGQQLIANLLLADDSGPAGSVLFRFTIGGQASVSFTNSNLITIVDNSIASPYPSAISVQGIGGRITKVTATIRNLTHGFPDDIDMVLEGPSGQHVTLMSDAGGRDDVSGLNITFDGDSTNQLSDLGPLTSGTFSPTNYAGPGTADAFPTLTGSFTNSDLSLFNGTDPNGLWKLYIVDDTGRDDGRITNGWVLRIETTDPVSPAADLSVTAQSASSNPLNLGNNQTYVLRVHNYGPSAAQGVFLTETLSESLELLSSVVSQGTAGQGAGGSGSGGFQWNVGTLASGASATATLTARANAVGTVSTVVHASGSQKDMWPANNTITMTTTIIDVPVLSVARVGGQVVLSWMLPQGPFSVESTDTLSNPNWQLVSQNITVTGGRVSMSVNASSAQKFYRLRLE